MPLLLCSCGLSYVPLLVVTSLLSSSREEMAREACPRDIMLLDYTILESHEISATTAFSIGWTSEAPDLFLKDAWWADGAY